MGAMYKGLAVSVVLSAIGFYPLISNMMAGQDIPVMNLYLCTLVGLVIAAGMFIITEYYTSTSWGPVQSIAKAPPMAEREAVTVMPLVPDTVPVATLERASVPLP